jgi:hypothetical protein
MSVIVLRRLQLPPLVCTWAKTLTGNQLLQLQLIFNDHPLHQTKPLRNSQEEVMQITDE